MRLRADGVLAVGIEDHDVSVGADGNRSFLRKQPEQFCGGRRCKLDETVNADSLLNDSAVVDQAHPMLDTGPSIRDLAEVAAPEFLLFLEAEWAMVGRN